MFIYVLYIYGGLSWHHVDSTPKHTLTYRVQARFVFDQSRALTVPVPSDSIGEYTYDCRFCYISSSRFFRSVLHLRQPRFFTSPGPIHALALSLAVPL